MRTIIKTAILALLANCTPADIVAPELSRSTIEAEPVDPIDPEVDPADPVVVTDPVDPEVAPWGVGSPVIMRTLPDDIVINVFAHLPVNQICMPNSKETNYDLSYVNNQYVENFGVEVVQYLKFVKNTYNKVHMPVIETLRQNVVAYQNEHLNMVRDMMAIQNLVEHVDYGLDFAASSASGTKGVVITFLNRDITFHGYCNFTYELN